MWFRKTSFCVASTFFNVLAVIITPHRRSVFGNRQGRRYKYFDLNTQNATCKVKVICLFNFLVEGSSIRYPTECDLKLYKDILDVINRSVVFLQS